MSKKSQANIKSGVPPYPDERYALVEIEMSGRERILAICQLERERVQDIVDEIRERVPDSQFRIDPLPVLSI